MHEARCWPTPQPPPHPWCCSAMSPRCTVCMNKQTVPCEARKKESRTMNSRNNAICAPYMLDPPATCYPQRFTHSVASSPARAPPPHLPIRHPSIGWACGVREICMRFPSTVMMLIYGWYVWTQTLLWCFTLLRVYEQQ